jgi:hypothetical protein
VTNLTKGLRLASTARVIRRSGRWVLTPCPCTRRIEQIRERLELISELVPQVKVITLISNPNDAKAESMIRETQGAARAKEVQLHVLMPAPRMRSTLPSPPLSNCRPAH